MKTMNKILGRLKCKCNSGIPSAEQEQRRIFFRRVDYSLMESERRFHEQARFISEISMKTL